MGAPFEHLALLGVAADRMVCRCLSIFGPQAQIASDRHQECWQEIEIASPRHATRPRGQPKHQGRACQRAG